jgi:purine-cytosine permease-like protein
VKLTPMQWAWFAASILFFGAVLLDVAGVLNVPGAFLIIVPIVLFAVSLVVGPSLKDLKRVNRRG